MSAKRRLLFPAVVACLLAPAVAFVLWFRANYEKRPVFVPGSDKARLERHDLTTAAAYLRASGLEVQVRRDLRFFGRLPRPGELLILRKPPTDAQGRLRQNLFDWVESGGHLVCAAGDVLQDGDRENALARRLGIRRAGLGISGKAEVQRLHTVLEGRRVRLELGGYSPALQLVPPCRPEWRVLGRVEWRSPLAAALPFLPPRYGAEPRDWALRMPLGKGSVTVLGDMSPLIGKGLGREDNAFLLSALARGHKRVWFWLPGREPTLLLRLIRGCPFFLGSLALLSLALLWSRQARLHPPIPLPGAARRDVLAYFEGAGRFAWRVNRAEALVRGNREHLAQLLKQRQGWAENLPKAEKLRVLEDRRLALRGSAGTLHELTRLTRALVRTVRALTRPGCSRPY